MLAFEYEAEEWANGQSRARLGGQRNARERVCACILPTHLSIVEIRDYSQSKFMCAQHENDMHGCSVSLCNKIDHA